MRSNNWTSVFYWDPPNNQWVTLPGPRTPRRTSPWFWKLLGLRSLGLSKPRSDERFCWQSCQIYWFVSEWLAPWTSKIKTYQCWCVWNSKQFNLMSQLILNNQYTPKLRCICFLLGVIIYWFIDLFSSSVPGPILSSYQPWPPGHMLCHAALLGDEALPSLPATCCTLPEALGGLVWRPRTLGPWGVANSAVN